MEPQIYNKELGIREIVYQSFNLFKTNIKSIMLLILALSVPFSVLAVLFNSLLPIIIILQIVAGLILTTAVIYLTKSSIDKLPQTELKPLVDKSFKKLWKVITTNLLMFICLLGLFLLLIVPGIIYSVYWMFSFLVVILKDISGKKAMDYSKSVVKGRWFKVFGYCVVFGILAFILSFLTGFIFLFIFGSNDFSTLLTDITLSIISVFFTVLFVIYFINLDSTKKEKVLVGGVGEGERV